MIEITSVLEMLILGYVSFWILILVHELGHYTAAKLVGIRVRKLVVGSGLRTQLEIGGLHVSLCHLPTHGFVLSDLCPRSFSFFRQSCFLAGGLTVQGVFLGLIYWYLFPHWSVNLDRQPYPVLYVGLAALLFGTYVAVKNTIPGKGIMEGQPFANDGLQLIQLWKKRKTLREHRGRLERLLRIYDAFDTGNHETAVIQLDIFCEQHSAQFDEVHALAYQAMEEGRFATARALYEAILKLKTISIDTRVSVLDGLASLVIYHEHWEWLTEAENWILEAKHAAPDKITLDGTYGGILVDAGKVDEAQSVLIKVFEKSKSALDKTISAAYLAKLAHERGDADNTRRWFKKSRAQGIHHIVADRIKKQLSGK
ncbi:MAG TPA: site-2 protease family protein [Lacunisphaera sp.]